VLDARPVHEQELAQVRAQACVKAAGGGVGVGLASAILEHPALLSADAVVAESTG
jgi:hypothetical protein